MSSASALAGLDQYTLDNLEPEERAALEGEEYSPQQQETLQELAKHAPKDDDTDAGEGGDSDAEIQPVPPVYQAQLPDDFAAQQAALKSDRDALAAKFRAGEIDFDSFQVENEKLQERHDDLARMQTKVDVASDIAAQRNSREWERPGIRLAERVARDDGFDYRTDSDKRDKLNTVLRALAQDPRVNAMTMDQVLAEAHRIAKASYGQTAAPPRAAAAAPDRQQVVRDDGDASATRSASPEGGEFAHIDALDGHDFEDALMAMSPAQRERYKRGL